MIRSEFDMLLRPQEQTMFHALLSGRLLHQEQLIVAIYSDCIDDSPLNVGMIIRIRIHSLRRKLKPYGVRIENKHGQGYRISPDTLGKARAMVSNMTLPVECCHHCGSVRVAS